MTDERPERLPRRSYWLPKEFHTWPEIRLAGPFAVGAFVSVGIWAHEQDKGGWVHESGLRPHDAAGAADQLVKTGLWRPQRNPYGWKGRTWGVAPMDELRRGRGTRGPILLLSRLLPGATEVIQAGNAAFGLWLLAASWSLTTITPGYVPTEVALDLGRRKQVEALWDSGCWHVQEQGFTMSQGTTPREHWWDLARDDQRTKIPKKIRDAVMARDGHRCVRCGSTYGLALDHIYPWSLGGPDTVDNLQVLCQPCNSSKRDRIEG